MTCQSRLKPAILAASANSSAGISFIPLLFRCDVAATAPHPQVQSLQGVNVHKKRDTSSNSA